jgi:hypothetical protein
LLIAGVESWFPRRCLSYALTRRHASPGNRANSKLEDQRMESRPIQGSILTRLREALGDPEIRKKAATLLLAKTIGLAIVLTIMTRWFLASDASADTAVPTFPAHINAINTVWTLVAA